MCSLLCSRDNISSLVASQVSPVQENVVIDKRPWWERYQPISFRLTTRSGTEAEFRDMVCRCNRRGVRIYVDVILNHMSSSIVQSVRGTGGSSASPVAQSYPSVPFNRSDFNWDRFPCGITDWNDPVAVRNCELVSLRDLNQAMPHVRTKIVEFLNKLIDIGVAGFRVDAAKHMWPGDLRSIYSELKRLNTRHGFPPNAYPYIAQEVIDLSMNGNNGAIRKFEYTPLAPVTEFLFSSELGRAFNNHYELNNLRLWGLWPDFVSTDDALVFVDNHDNQRGDDHIISYHTPRRYKMATAWALAHPYGNVRIMSSFRFDRPSGHDIGPPADAQGKLLSPHIRPDGTCDSRWICEHRWRQITNMINFRNVAGRTPQSHWWSNGHNQIAICRGNRTFAAWNNENRDLNERMSTCLPAGTYCDIISGQRNGDRCTGTNVTVDATGYGQIQIRSNAEDGVFAIHIGSLSRLP